MSETQIYKWWWDQTRKRMRKLKNSTSLYQAVEAEEGSELQGVKSPAHLKNQDRNSKVLGYEGPGVLASADRSNEESLQISDRE